MDRDEWITVPACSVEVGLERHEAELIKERFSGDRKIQHIFSSCPRHMVMLQSFRISTKLISFNEFRSFILGSGYVTDAEKEGWGWLWDGGWKKSEGLSWHTAFGSDTDDLYRQNGTLSPVVQVSWNDAVSYCRWLSEKEGGYFYLPNEYQWEGYAVHRGAYSIKDAAAADVSFSGNHEYWENVLDAVENVRDHSSGLLWEWTDSWFQSYPGGVDNKDFGETYKVLRGGSLLSSLFQRGREFRFRRCPTARSPYYGFRIACDDSKR